MELEVHMQKNQPNNGVLYQNALEHMASIDLIELCNEAKIERCRATRDLSSCGRYVQHVLNSCGHASLCAECSQRCDVCPICRTSLPTAGSRVQLRLYYKCIEAGLISKRYDDRFQEKKDNDELADIERLYFLFDVALENNLVSLICHYVTDVCMDESAVSSDPVLAFLLDEVVVKDWCKRKFKKIISDLCSIYSLGTEEMKAKLDLLQKFVQQLTGISSVLDVMDTSFKQTLSTQLHDLHDLLENTLKAKQHLEVMTWCIQHHFLEEVQSRYCNSSEWKMAVGERKSAAIQRSWPNFASDSAASPGLDKATLFIEEALSNLEIEQSYDQDIEEELDISCLQDEDSPLLFRSKIDELNTNRREGCYPFGNLRVATDVLFLHGTSDMVVAKRAIFLYYLFDQHWTRPDAGWRYLVDDFAAVFGITRHSLLESLVFYLLDDNTDLALQEASILLPEIACPETHPKIAQVLLERQRPDVALTVLRCTGRDGTSAFASTESISLDEAVTIVRVKIECGLLTEAFMYQRMHCSRVKEENIKHAIVVSDSSRSDSWIHHVEVLVSEICYLCSRRNLVDRIIELPWNSDEEKHIHKCLFEYAVQDPSTIYGSLLVVFYLQRYQYIKAYQVHQKLQCLEQNIMESSNDEIISKIRSRSCWRTMLAEKSINLLPEGERKQVMMGNVDASSVLEMSHDRDLPNESQSPVTLSNSSFIKPSLVLQTNLNSYISKKPSGNTNTSLSSPTGGHLFELGNKGPSIINWRMQNNSDSPTFYRINTLSKGFYSNPGNGDYMPASETVAKHLRQQDGVKQGYRPAGISLLRSNSSLSQNYPSRESNATPSRAPPNDLLLQGDQSPFGTESNKFTDLTGRTPYSNGFFEESLHDQSAETLGKNMPDRSWTNMYRNEANMNYSWSLMKGDSPTEESNTKCVSRWRSDESSDDEDNHGLQKHRAGNTPFVLPRRTKHHWR